jgi:drug/metabolite transporter (DMT)-like permease
MNKTALAHISLFIVALIYAGNYLVAKEVLDPGYIRPFGFILLRAISGVTVFWIFDLLFIRARIEKKDFPLLALSGLFGVAINQMCFFAGLKQTVPINASLLMTTSPILVLLIASVVLKERITSRKLIGILLGMFGAVMLITNGFKESFSQSGRFWGDLLIIVNASSYGIYLVIVKKLMIKYPPLLVIKWVFTFGLIPIFLFGWPDIPQIEWNMIPGEIYAAIAYVLLLTTVIAYFLNAYSLTIVSPTVTSIYIYLQPLLTSALAIAFVKDSLDLTKIISGLLILIGVFLVSRSKYRKIAQSVDN